MDIEVDALNATSTAYIISLKKEFDKSRLNSTTE